MKKIRIFVLIMLTFIFTAATFAFDLSDFGDFTSRSAILNDLNQRNYLTQERKDLLMSKKLTPTAKCLFEQIKAGNIENVNLMLNSNVNPNNSYMGDYPIYTAAKLNNFEMLKLLYEHGAKIDKGFNSELYEALSNKNEQMAQFLIENGANVNYIDSVTDNSVLYIALKNNMENIASLMIQKGARADAKSAKFIKKKKLFNLIENTP